MTRQNLRKHRSNREMWRLSALGYAVGRFMPTHGMAWQLMAWQLMAHSCQFMQFHGRKHALCFMLTYREKHRGAGGVLGRGSFGIAFSGKAFRPRAES